MKPSRCKSCAAEIVWAATPHGKAMPLDARAELRFTIDTDLAGAVRCQPMRVHQSHFASCPHADQHRKERR